MEGETSFQTEMNKSTKQVAVSVAGYITKTVGRQANCTDCKLKLIANERLNKHDEYLNLLSRVCLTTPCPSVCDFSFQIFSMLDFILPIAIEKYKMNPSEMLIKKLLNLNYLNVGFVCKKHDWGNPHLSMVNIFFNNEPKNINNSVRKSK